MLSEDCRSFWGQDLMQRVHPLQISVETSIFAMKTHFLVGEKQENEIGTEGD
jgi:hypothetical protein